MLVIEGHKPIGDVVEEGIALHMLETLEEEVHTLTALVHITAHPFLYLLHLLLGVAAPENVVHGVVFLHFHALVGESHVGCLHYVGHDGFLELL